MRRGWQLRPETDSLYDLVVAAEGEFDREAWAEIVRECLDAEQQALGKKHGTKTAFATKVKVSVRTLDNWLDKQVDATEANVRGVARAYQRNEFELLIRVGLASIDSLLAASAQLDPDEELNLIAEAPISAKAKERLVRRLLAWQERDRARRIDDLKEEIAQLERVEPTA